MKRRRSTDSDEGAPKRRRSTEATKEHRSDEGAPKRRRSTEATARSQADPKTINLNVDY
jgi:hypothetical protein